MSSACRRRAARPAFPHERLLEMGYQSRHSCRREQGRWRGDPGARGPPRHRAQLRARPSPRHRRGAWLEFDDRGDHDRLGLRARRRRSRAARRQRASSPSWRLWRARPTSEHSHPLLIAGDFNVAPSDQDVYEPAWFDGSYQTGAAERADLRAILTREIWSTVYRRLHPHEHGFTCWDQREGHYARDYGLRIDLILASEELAPYVGGLRGQPHLPPRLPPLQPRAAGRRALRSSSPARTACPRGATAACRLRKGDAHGPRSHAPLHSDAIVTRACCYCSAAIFQVPPSLTSPHRARALLARPGALHARSRARTVHRDRLDRQFEVLGSH